MNNKEELILEGNDSPIAFIKFGQKKNIDKLVSGEVYMRSSEYYQKAENEEVGDSTDAVGVANQATMKYVIDGKCILEGTGTSQIKDLEKIKRATYCLFALRKDNFKVIYINGNITKVKIVFSQEQKSKLKDFGDTALIISTCKFIQSLKKALEDEYKMINLYHRSVTYYDPSINDASRLIDCAIHQYDSIPFYKKNKYKHQNEYRFIVDKIVDDHFSLNIGDIQHISHLISTEDLLQENLEINIRDLQL